MATLVAFFSAEGRTAKVAHALSRLTKAELFEIKPEVPYSSSDINWKNPLARCNKEKIVKASEGVEGLKKWVKSNIS